jgi:6-phosphogluconolactonase
MAETVIIPGADDAAIADWLCGRLAKALGASETVAIAVPGGSTPFPILKLLVQKDFDWARLEVWPGDDRLVPESDEASNVGRIRAIFEPTGAKIVALAESAAPPHFTLAWLGMGNDGHIASLFPNTDPRGDDPLPVRRLRPDPLPPEAPFERVSLTIPALINSDELVFVIRGPEKRALFEEAMRGGNDLPVARLLKAASLHVTCFA